MFREQLTSSSEKRALSVSGSATSSSDVNRRSFFLEATLIGEKGRHYEARLSCAASRERERETQGRHDEGSLQGKKIPRLPPGTGAHKPHKRGVKKSQATRKSEGGRRRRRRAAEASHGRPRQLGQPCAGPKGGGGRRDGTLKRLEVLRAGSCRARGSGRKGLLGFGVEARPTGVSFNRQRLIGAGKRGYAERTSEEKRLEIHTHPHRRLVPDTGE